MKLNARKRFDLLVLLGLLVFAAGASLYFRLGVIASITLYLLVPAVYLCFRQKKNYFKIILCCVWLNILGTSLDIVAQRNDAWLIPVASPVLSYPLWGVMPVWFYYWGVCVVLLAVVFYEHFLDEQHSGLSKRFKYIIIPSFIIFFLIGWAAISDPHALHIPYAYLVVWGVAELPLLWVIFRKPALLYKILWLGLFFFILNFTFEFTALSLHQWSFPGQYVGWVNMFGLSFPLEELVLWITLSSPAVVVYWELFFDDGK